MEKFFSPFGLSTQGNIKPSVSNNPGEFLENLCYLKPEISQLLHEKIQELKSHIYDPLSSPASASPQELLTVQRRGGGGPLGRDSRGSPMNAQETPGLPHKAWGRPCRASGIKLLESHSPPCP